MGLLKFELKKFILSKRNIIFLSLLSCVVIFSHVYEMTSNGGNSASMRSAMLNNAKYNMQQTIGLQNGTSNQSDGKTVEQLYKGQIQAIQANKPDEYYNLVYSLDALTVSSDKGVAEAADEVSAAKSEMQYINTVRNRGLSFEWMPTAQLHAFGFYVQLTLQMLGSALFALAFAILIATSLSSHFEKKENRFSTFAALGHSKILITKVAAALTVTFGWILMVSLVDIVAVGFVNGFGSLNYPAYLLSNGLSGVADPRFPSNMAIPVGQVMLFSLVYFVLVLLFISAIGALLSVLAKRSLVVVGVFAVLVVGWSMIATNPAFRDIRPFVPMSYLNPVELLCNPTYLFGKSSLLVGVVYLLFVSMVCLFIANHLLANYKIRRL